MGDEENESTPAAPPAWQQTKAAPEPETTSEADLEVARRFLDDDEVKASPHEKKVEFLRSKNISEAQIATLLLQDGQEDETQSVVQDNSSVEKREHAAPETTHSDRPPIVTYPEFLAKPERPPPLTTSRLLGALNAMAALSAVIYGTSKFVVTPMVESLTGARVDLHDTTSSKLSGLVNKLEKTVSEIPPAKKPLGADDASDTSDPSEMFHRDIGTQTVPLRTLPSSTSAATASQTGVSESQRQAERLSTLTKTLSGLRDGYRSESEDLQDLKTLVDVFRDDLDAMTYGNQAEFVGGYDVYNKRKKDPDDELRRARDNVRRIKGLLLSSRSFPASTR